MRLVTAYQASQVVAVATRLRIPDILGNGPVTSGEIARKTATQPEMMHRLLRALAAFAIVKDLGAETFELTAVGDCLRADAPDSIFPVALMYGGESHWHTFASLSECVRTGRNAFEILYGVESSFAYHEEHRHLGRIFDDAMSAGSALAGAAVAEAYDFAGINHIVDVGGGQGKLLASILKAHPHLRGTLFDLPRVVGHAAPLLTTEGVADRCKVIGGEVFSSVPAGGDLYLLSRVIHDWDDAGATKVLQTCRRSMQIGAKLLIFELVMPERITPGPAAQKGVIADLRMMVATRGGRERTAAEFEALLSTADLRLERIIATTTTRSLIEAAPA